MWDENREAEMRAENVDTVDCPNCGATLVAGLRFCRMCGYRLGEGVEEYVATQRLDANAPPVAAQSNATDPFAARATWGQAPLQPLGTTSLNHRREESRSSWLSACNPRRAGWLTWMILMLVLLTAAGVVTKSVRNRVAGGGRGAAAAALPANSVANEVDDLDTADGGRPFILGLSGPDPSLDLAGLKKGDVIVEFNGKQIRTPGDLRLRIYEAIPGSIVNVTLMRDGQRLDIPLKMGRDRD